MTCIVGLVDNGTVFIGGDSAGVGGYDIRQRADEKVFRNGPFLFGFTSSFRMGQLLRYKFTPPLHHDSVELHQFMATSFVDEVRRCLKDGGFARTVEGEEKAGRFLVGYHGHLFMVDGDYQVGESIYPYEAVGCGDHLALGCMFANEGQRPEVRIRQALEAAEQFSAGVPRTILDSENNGGSSTWKLKN